MLSLTPIPPVTIIAPVSSLIEGTALATVKLPITTGPAR